MEGDLDFNTDKGNLGKYGIQVVPKYNSFGTVSGDKLWLKNWQQTWGGGV